jgi:hypothetical protein
MRLHRWMLVLVLAGSVFMAGCAPQTAEEEPQQEVAGTEEQMTEDVQEAQEMSITMTESDIGVEPNTVETGPANVRVTNNANQPRRVVIGMGEQETRTEPLQPGETKSYNIDLSSTGTYEIVSPAPDEQAERLSTTLTVEERAQQQEEDQPVTETQPQGQ